MSPDVLNASTPENAVVFCSQLPQSQELQFNFIGLVPQLEPHALESEQSLQPEPSSQDAGITESSFALIIASVSNDFVKTPSAAVTEDVNASTDERVAQ